MEPVGCVELHLGELWQRNLLPYELCSEVWRQTFPLCALQLKLETLSHGVELAFEVLEFGGHRLGAVVLVQLVLGDDHLALVAAVDAMLTRLVVTWPVFLKHLSFATVIGTLNDGVVACFLMGGQIAIVDNHGAAFVLVLAPCPDLLQVA